MGTVPPLVGAPEVGGARAGLVGLNQVEEGEPAGAAWDRAGGCWALGDSDLIRWVLCFCVFKVCLTATALATQTLLQPHPQSGTLMQQDALP